MRSLKPVIVKCIYTVCRKMDGKLVIRDVTEEGEDIQNPRKTKIGTEVAPVTRDSDTTFKVKR